MRLCECKEGQEIIVRNISTDPLTLKRLQLMGISVGGTLLVAKESCGSVLVVSCGKMIALGKALSQEVVVDACTFSR